MFVIITTGLNGAKTELCRVERNAEQIAEAAREQVPPHREAQNETVYRRADHRAGAAIIMTSQLDMFCSSAADTSKIIGLKVRLDRPIDRERPCCLNVCTIGPARGPHAGELLCAGCGQHRGWLSKSTAAWVEHVITRFGAPTTPIVVRASTLEQEEAPGTDKTTLNPN